MKEEELAHLLQEQHDKLDKIYISVEKTRKYFFWTMIITLAMVILPLIGLIFAIPSFLGVYSSVQGL